MTIRTALVVVLLSSVSAFAQTPYAGMETRAIKSLSEQQIADLSAGRGMGLELAAELNGYPGPVHAVELAEQLRLSADQVTKLKALFEAMKAETIPIGATQAALRAAHLKYHLTTVAILTPEQVVRYNELRGYTGHAAPAHHHQQMHHR
mgnify:CR=1 FL=1